MLGLTSVVGVQYLAIINTSEKEEEEHQHTTCKQPARSKARKGKRQRQRQNPKIFGLGRLKDSSMRVTVTQTSK